jgi:RND family efflux transporter MFP subunit
MPRPRHVRPAALAAALVALAACRGGGQAPAPAPGVPAAAAAAAPPPAPPAAAHLVLPEKVRYAPRVVATGSLKARQQAPLAMSVPGTLARIAVRRGQDVKEGALLAALDDGAATAARQQAEAAVAAAKVQVELAEDALRRISEIGREGGVAESQLFEVRSRRDLARAQLAAAEAQLAQARVNLDHHFLRAPFGGVVTRVPDGVGLTVAAGVPLVTLVATRPLVLETSLTQDEAAEVRAGARATVRVPATGARTDEGEVRVVVAAVDPQTNRVPVEIAVPNADGRFLPNAFARAELSRGGERDAWRVPAGALVQRDGGYAAWTAGADGKARALPVRVLGEERDAAIVVPAQGGGWPDGLRALDAAPLGLVEGALVAEAAR